jgi:ribosome-associated translation inhibitor RaiA
MPNRSTQWDDQRSTREVPVDVVALGPVEPGAEARAEHKVRRVLGLAGEPVLEVRVKLAVAPDPAVERPALAEAALDVNGHLVRAQVAARTTHEAVDLLQDRLRDQLVRRAEHLRARRHVAPSPAPGEWRHGQVPVYRPERYRRPVDEREVVRRKTFAPGEATVDEAAFDMEMLGHDFHLFTDLATGEDALLERLDDGHLRLRRLRATSVRTPEPVIAVDAELDGPVAPVLTEDDAREWLDAGTETFVFFADRATGRAKVAYSRYDGHYGIIESAASPPAP